jgi:hypothetical protein
MRGVEGAGAYRIGHPLAQENADARFGFRIFSGNVADFFFEVK